MLLKQLSTMHWGDNIRNHCHEFSIDDEKPGLCYRYSSSDYWCNYTGTCHGNWVYCRSSASTRAFRVLLNVDSRDQMFALNRSTTSSEAVSRAHGAYSAYVLIDYYYYSNKHFILVSCDVILFKNNVKKFGVSFFAFVLISFQNSKEFTKIKYFKYFKLHNWF